MSKQHIIGTNALGYPEIRNFAGHHFDDFRFVKANDFYKIPSYLLFKTKGKINRKWQNTFFDAGFNNCEFFHFFNVLNAGPKPYITTYETRLPRWRDTPADFKKGLALLARDNCRQLIALSECAHYFQKQIVNEFAPELSDSIAQKNIVMLPPQMPFLEQWTDKKTNNNFITFTIVGADFFRKGGQAIVNAFTVLLEKKKPVKLNIVSSLNYGDYVTKTEAEDASNVRRFATRFSDNVTLYNKLSNQKVKELLITSDIALLPSLAETFGYFTLEAQAAGCPVITTDIRAMPEINNSERGWLIPVKDTAYDISADNIKPALNTITEQLIGIVESVLVQPEIISLKSRAAFENILTRHNPDSHKLQLEKIYKSIIL